MLKPEEITVVVYHGGCQDGYTAAMIAHRALKALARDASVTFVPWYHGRTSSVTGLDGEAILVLDLAPPRATLLDWIERTRGRVLVLDHHKTGAADLAGVDSQYVVFDQERCGASLAWRYFHPDVPQPRMVSYVEDNDLWRKALPKTNEFTNYLASVPFEFDAYERLLDDQFLDSVVFPIGEGMLRQSEASCAQLLRRAYQRLTRVGGRWALIAYVPSAILKSELGNQVFKHCPFADFSAVGTPDHTRGSTAFSLRSQDNRQDVSAVAALFGGGGHRNAAGMAVELLTDYLPGRAADGIAHLLAYVYAARWGSSLVAVVNTPVHTKKLTAYLMQPGHSTPSIADAVIVTAKTVRGNNSPVETDTESSEDDGADSATVDAAIAWWQIKGGYHIRGVTRSLELIKSLPAVVMTAKNAPAPDMVCFETVLGHLPWCIR